MRYAKPPSYLAVLLAKACGWEAPDNDVAQIVNSIVCKGGTLRRARDDLAHVSVNDVKRETGTVHPVRASRFTATRSDIPGQF